MLTRSEAMRVIKEDALYNPAVADMCLNILDLLENFWKKAELKEPYELYFRPDAVAMTVPLVCDLLKVGDSVEKEHN